jgi:N-acetylmuramoyl-L-alanine amidase
MAFNSNTKARASTDYLVVHCSATGNQKVTAADIDRWHRKQGWVCLGYHFVIQRDGTLEEGRKEEAIGAHVAGHNHNSIGICMVGGVDANDPTKAKNNFTEEQFKTLELLLKHLKAKYPKAVIQGHRDFPNVKKACPSFSVADWLKTVGIKQ